MAKQSDSGAGDAGTPAPTQTTTEGAETPQQTAQQTVTVDDASAQAGYANFCRVSSTGEELVLDLGLNPNPFAAGNITIRVGQRVIMNHFTAKRLLLALNAAVSRHEQTFGVLETDIRKRVRSK